MDCTHAQVNYKKNKIQHTEYHLITNSIKPGRETGTASFAATGNKQPELN